MNTARRMKFLIENYVEARLSGPSSGYDIRPVEPENYEHYYILIQPRAGVSKGHSYIIEMKTSYGHGSDVMTYPINAPYMHFITNIFHVNISANGGAICLDMLKDKAKWSSMNSFDTVVQNILLLFDEPNNSSPFNGEASKIWVHCDKELKSFKSGKMSVEDMDKLHAKAFEPFNREAIKVMQSNKYKIYGQWFPSLDPEHPDYCKRVTEDAEQFAELKRTYDEMQSKMRAKVKDAGSASKDKPNIKPSGIIPTVIDMSASKDKPTVEPTVEPTSTTDAAKKKNRWAKYQK